MVKIKRIYEKPAKTDGYRILVDRLWPRGVSKQEAAIDEWFKDIAPSNELREWFGHDPAKFKSFASKYSKELSGNPATQDFLKAIKSHTMVTLLYGAKDTEHNQAVVLLDFIQRR